LSYIFLLVTISIKFLFDFNKLFLLLNYYFLLKRKLSILIKNKTIDSFSKSDKKKKATCEDENKKFNFFTYFEV